MHWMLTVMSSWFLPRRRRLVILWTTCFNIEITYSVAWVHERTIPTQRSQLVG
jgi:hypothetical protein